MILLHLIPLFDDLPDEGQYVYIEYSPNKRWTARETSVKKKIGNVEYVYTRLEITDAFSDREYLVYEKIYVDCCMEGGIPEIVKWSEDETEVFLVERLAGDGCFPKAYRNLTRLNLITGASVILKKAGFYEFAISPNDKYLTYLDGDSFGINIVSLLDNSEKAINLENLKTDSENSIIWWIDDLVWSPDSSAITFSITHDACGNEQNEIGLLVMNQSGVKIIHDVDDADLFPIAWFPEGIIIKQASIPFRYWIMDSVSGELSPFE